MYASTGEDPSLPVRVLMNLNACVRCMLVYSVPAVDLDAALENVSCALGEGALSPLPFHRFSLEQIADAHRAVEEGVVGKVVIDVA